MYMRIHACPLLLLSYYCYYLFYFILITIINIITSIIIMLGVYSQTVLLLLLLQYSEKGCIRTPFRREQPTLWFLVSNTLDFAS